MGKFLKILGIIIAGLALLVVLAVTIIPMVVPWDSMLTGAVKDSLGRPATVQDVSVSLWGGLEAEVKGLVIKDKPAYGDRPLVKLDSLTVRADLWPLLASSLVVRQVRVDNLELSMVRGKNGRINWSDVPRGKKEEREHRGRKEHDGDDGHLIVSSLKVTGSKVFIKNLANGMSSELPLERFDLSSDLTTGGAGGQVSLAMPGLSVESAGQSKGYGDDFVLQQGKLGLKLDLAALAERLAPLFPGLKAKGMVEISGLAQGPAKALKVQAQGRAQGLWVQTTAMGQRYFSLPEATLMADLTLDLPGETAKIGQAQFTAPAAGLVQTMSGDLGWGKSLGKSDARFEQRLDLGKMAAFISPLMPWPVKASGLASKQVRFKGAGPGVLEISGENRGKDIYFSCPAMAAPFKDPSMRAVYRFLVKEKEDEFEIKQLDLDMAAAKLGLVGMLASKGRELKVRLKVKGDYLDLDRLPFGPPSSGLQRPANRAKAVPAKGGSAAVGQAKAGGMGSGGGKAAPDPAQIRRNLQGIDAEAEVELGLVRAQGYELKDLKLLAKIKDAKALIDELKAKFLGGKIKMFAGVDFNPAVPLSKLELEGEGLKVTPPVFRKLKQDLPLFSLPLSGLNGVFDLFTEIEGKGLTAETLAASAKGKGGLKARDGVSIELAFLEQVQGLAALWQDALGKLPRRFAKFEGKYKIGGGRVNYDIALKAGDDEMDAMIVGSTGLLDGSLDATFKFDASTVGHTLREVLAPDGTFPIKLGGTVEHPVPQLALGGVPAEKAVEGLLKGLFNR